MGEGSFQPARTPSPEKEGQSGQSHRPGADSASLLQLQPCLTWPLRGGIHQGTPGGRAVPSKLGGIHFWSLVGHVQLRNREALGPDLWRAWLRGLKAQSQGGTELEVTLGNPLSARHSSITSSPSNSDSQSWSVPGGCSLLMVLEGLGHKGH